MQMIKLHAIYVNDDWWIQKAISRTVSIDKMYVFKIFMKVNMKWKILSSYDIWYEIRSLNI